MGMGRSRLGVVAGRLGALAKRIPRSARRLPRLRANGRNLDPPRLARVGLWDMHRQHAVRDRGGYLVGVEPLGHLEDQLELPVAALQAVPGAVLLAAEVRAQKD